MDRQALAEVRVAVTQTGSEKGTTMNIEIPDLNEDNGFTPEDMRAFLMDLCRVATEHYVCLYFTECMADEVAWLGAEPWHMEGQYQRDPECGLPEEDLPGDEDW